MKGSAQTCSHCSKVYESGCVVTYLCRDCTQELCVHDWMPPFQGTRLCRKCTKREETTEVDPISDANLIRNLNMQYGIECREGVCGGKAVLFGTRIRVSHLYALKEMGWDCDQMIRDYPQLTREQIVKAMTYAHQHKEQMAHEIAEEAEQ
jgi:uncharacterized protein (DUF433 family)